MDYNLTDIGAERAVLAGLFQYGIDAYVEVADVINASSFGHENNQVLYACVQHVVENNSDVDLPSILSAASALNHSERVENQTELQYIKSLFDFPVSQGNIFNFAVQIKKFEFARNIKKLTLKIHKDMDSVNGSESIDEIIGKVEDPVMDFLREDDGGERPEKIGKDVDEYIEFITENKCDVIGIPSGFDRFDHAIGGGLRRKCVDLVAARPKVGKSVFADNVALNVASDGIPVLVLDTEMSKEDHLNRIIANLSGVPIQDVATGKFIDDDEQNQKVHEAVEHISQIPYNYVSVAGKPFEQILNIIKRWIIQDVKMDDNGRTNECVVVYDYLKLMSSNSITNNIQEYQALGFQITNLHNLAVKFDFPCLSFVQLNRDGITKESTDAVSGSDRLIWLCTSFSIFKSKSPEELAEDGPQAGNRKLVPIVSRHGAGLSDGDYINMRMLGEHAKLVELKTRNEFKSQPIGDSGLIDAEGLEKVNEDVEEDGLEEDQKAPWE
jgi:replicative DNA helicase|tara:strand:- start:2382 stop:3872 length:1491 start_codon:yes stop_codon:yes gene_type:complete